jgi:hypothetical protein
VLPALIHDSLTTPFNFYRGDCIHQGIICQNRMHALVKAFSRHQRGHAMALALKLAQHNVQPLITVSVCSNYYRVWVDLQSHDSKLLNEILAGKYSKISEDEADELMVGQFGAIALA